MSLVTYFNFKIVPKLHAMQLLLVFCLVTEVICLNNLQEQHRKLKLKDTFFQSEKYRHHTSHNERLWKPSAHIYDLRLLNSRLKLRSNTPLTLVSPIPHNFSTQLPSAQNVISRWAHKNSASTAEGYRSPYGDLIRGKASCRGNQITGQKLGL